MIIGCDTGFFLKLLHTESQAESYWERIISGELRAVVSILTLFELSVLAEKNQIERQSVQVMKAAIQALCQVAGVDLTTDFVGSAALMVENTCSPTQAILAQLFKNKEVKLILTTDSFFKTLALESVEIVLL